MSAKPSVVKFALTGFISNVSVSNLQISALSAKMFHSSAPDVNLERVKKVMIKKISCLLYFTRQVQKLEFSS